MEYSMLSVQERIALLKSIFNDFGMPVITNSTLDQAIHAEFGRGKRSKLTILLNDLQSEPDCIKLAKCIGEELVHNTQDPELLRVGGIFQEHLPKLLQVIDIKQTTAKRELLLAELLDYFKEKIPQNAGTERLHRMLIAAQINLHASAQLQNLSANVSNLGSFLDVHELKACGNVLKNVMPALIMLDQPDVLLEQKVNYCLRALQSLSLEFKNQKLSLAADILQDINWLAKVTLSDTLEPATVEQALQNLGITMGNASIQLIHRKAQRSGLTDQEIAKIIYTGALSEHLSLTDGDLLRRTQENQQYAAICAYIAKLAQDIKQPNLSKIGIIGISLASMRQIFYEFTTHNVCAENFSEALGNILLGAGTVTNNALLSYVGSSIINGVKTYTGLMAVPGGAAIAVPLAVCSSLTSLFLVTGPRKAPEEKFNANQVMFKLLEQVLLMQQNMRQHFAALYEKLQIDQQHLLMVLDNSFNSLAKLLRENTLQVLTDLKKIDHKLHGLQYEMHKEFADLYLEDIFNPLTEIDFAVKYG